MLSDPGQISYYYYLLSKPKQSSYTSYYRHFQSACSLNFWGKDEIDYLTTALKLKCHNIFPSAFTAPREFSYIRLLMEYDGIFFLHYVRDVSHHVIIPWKRNTISFEIFLRKQMILDGIGSFYLSHFLRLPNLIYNDALTPRHNWVLLRIKPPL